MEFKYIAVKIDNDVTELLPRDTEEHIFIFPKCINHDDYYRNLHNLRIHTSWKDWERLEVELLGAGFTDLKRCYGRSETLNCNSREIEDSRLLGSVSSERIVIQQELPSVTLTPSANQLRNRAKRARKK